MFAAFNAPTHPGRANSHARHNRANRSSQALYKAYAVKRLNPGDLVAVPRDPAYACTLSLPPLFPFATSALSPYSLLLELSFSSPTAAASSLSPPFRHDPPKPSSPLTGLSFSIHLFVPWPLVTASASFTFPSPSTAIQRLSSPLDTTWCNGHETFIQTSIACTRSLPGLP